MPYIIDEAHTLIGPATDEQRQLIEDLRHAQSCRPASVFSPIQSLTSRHTYWADGEWRINFNGTEYSDFPWIDRLAAFEDLGLEPAEIQRAYNNCVQFLNAMDDISLAEVQKYAKAKKEGRVVILPEGTKCDTLHRPQPAVTVDPVSDSRAAHLNRFSESATRAYNSKQEHFTCPVCEKTATIIRLDKYDGFKAECPSCGIKISKW